MILSLIAAVSENGVIGREGKLPWDLPDDLQYFRKVTQGKPVIMGRKTLESIGRVLPERTNIIITKKQKLSIKNHAVLIAHSLSEAIELASRENPEEVFVIGGGEIFKEAMGKAQRIYLTLVHAEIDGNVYFPEVLSIFWRETSKVEHPKDQRHAYPFTFIVYNKRKLIA